MTLLISFIENIVDVAGKQRQNSFVDIFGVIVVVSFKRIGIILFRKEDVEIEKLFAAVFYIADEHISAVCIGYRRRYLRSGFVEREQSERRTQCFFAYGGKKTHLHIFHSFLAEVRDDVFVAFFIGYLYDLTIFDKFAEANGKIESVDKIVLDDDIVDVRIFKRFFYIFEQEQNKDFYIHFFGKLQDGTSFLPQNITCI